MRKLALLLAFAGCAGGIDGSSAVTAKIDGRSVVPGPKLFDCWLDAGAAADGGDQLRCAYSPPSTDYPLQPSKISVAVQGHGDATSVGVFSTATFDPLVAAHQDVASLHAVDYPASLFLFVDLRSDDPELLGDGDGSLSSVYLQQSLASSNARVTGAALPWQLWPIDIDAAADLTSAHLDAYTLAMAPWAAVFDSPVVRTPSLPSIKAGGKASFYLAVNADTTKLTGHGQSCVNGACVGHDFAITAPGHYVADASGLHAVAVVNDGPDGGAAPGGPDLAPGSTCGGDDQSPCIDSNGNGSCSSGTQLDSNDGRCHACGGDGQRWCKDGNGNALCNSGTVIDNRDGQCHACGKDGLRWCLDGNGNALCSGGTVIDNRDGQCHACGKDGLRWCLDSNGNALCNGGTVIDSRDGMCHACGSAGLRWCLDANGNAICTPPALVDSASGLCR